jgi:hypothetical protein
MPARHSINKIGREAGIRPGERPAGTELEEVVEGLGVVAPGMRRLDRVQDQLAQQSLGRGEGEGSPALLSGV